MQKNSIIITLTLGVALAVAGSFLGASVGGFSTDGPSLKEFLSVMLWLVIIAIAYISMISTLTHNMHFNTEDSWSSFEDLYDIDDDNDNGDGDMDGDSKTAEPVSRGRAPSGVPPVIDLRSVPFDIETAEPTFQIPNETPRIGFSSMTPAPATEPSVNVPGATGGTEDATPRALRLPELPIGRPSVATGDAGAKGVALIEHDMSTYRVGNGPCNEAFIDVLEDAARRLSDDGVLVLTGNSYGLGARGRTLENSPRRRVEYTHADISKMTRKQRGHSGATAVGHTAAGTDGFARVD